MRDDVLAISIRDAPRDGAGARAVEVGVSFRDRELGAHARPVENSGNRPVFLNHPLIKKDFTTETRRHSLYTAKDLKLCLRVSVVN